MKHALAVDVLTQKVAQLGGFVAQRAAPPAQLDRLREQIAGLNAAIAVLELAAARAKKTASRLRPRTGAGARGTQSNSRGKAP